MTRRVLYIGSGSPWAGGAGFLVRQNLFLRTLEEVADLHLAMFNAAPGDAPPVASGFTSLPSPVRGNSSRIQNWIADQFSPMPRMLRGYEVSPARQAVAALEPEKFDAIFAYRIDFAHFAGVLNHPRLILDIDDPEHIRWRRRIRATTGHDGDRRTMNDIEKLRTFERTAVAGAKLAFVCQENDANDWPVRPTVIPNCVDVVENPSRRATRPRLLFIGNCAGSAQSPNVDAVFYFLSDIWPTILKALPDAEFQIVGSTSNDVRSVAEASQNVMLSGFVDKLPDVYAQAAVSIAPIRFGTGTRIKILEAFAHACPVISTLAGVEGIAAVPGKEIELADAAADFAIRCIDMLQDAQMRERIGQGGHQLAARLYNRDVQHHRIIQILRQFFDRNPPSAEGSHAAQPSVSNQGALR